MAKEKSTSATKTDKATTRDVTKTDNVQTGAKPKNPLPEQKQPRPGIEKKVTPRPQIL